MISFWNASSLISIFEEEKGNYRDLETKGWYFKQQSRALCLNRSAVHPSEGRAQATSCLQELKPLLFMHKMPRKRHRQTVR